MRSNSNTSKTDDDAHLPPSPPPSEMQLRNAATVPRAHPRDVREVHVRRRSVQLERQRAREHPRMRSETRRARRGEAGERPRRERGVRGGLASSAAGAAPRVRSPRGLLQETQARRDTEGASRGGRRVRRGRRVAVVRRASTRGAAENERARGHLRRRRAHTHRPGRRGGGGRGRGRRDASRDAGRRRRDHSSLAVSRDRSFWKRGAGSTRFSKCCTTPRASRFERSTR